MRSLICTTPGTLEYWNLPDPEPMAGRSILRIRRVGICGTDLHAFEGTQPYFTYPRILGHELAGDLVEGGSGRSGSPAQGDGRLTILPYFACGVCIACRQGKPNCCVALQVCGVHIDGGMVEYLSVPSDALVSGEGLSYDALALVEPMAIGAHGVRRAAVQEGEYVLVMGAGPIGLSTMALAQIAGAKVIALDGNERRLQFCKETLGVDHTITVGDPNRMVEAIRDCTFGDMPTVVIDATGNLGAIENGLDYLAHGGRYVLIGLQREAFRFSHPDFHRRETTLMSSRNATREDFEHVIACMRKGLVDPLRFITQRVAFEEVGGAFAGWLDPARGVIKAMVQM
jgi:2-desacetyl-2-hydroxyethyl bacteriochlorophyllide A dehydrogenase